METTCGSLLFELQKIWDEIGEADNERDKMLFELEQECMDAYRKKVDQASLCRAQLRQAVVDAEAQLADIYAALGDRPVHANKHSGSLRKELQAIMPVLENMKKKRNERKAQLSEVWRQINCISKELSGSMEDNSSATLIGEHDFSIKRLDDLRYQLALLQNEKNERMKQVLDQLNVLNALCIVLGIEFNSTVCSVHPSLVDESGLKSISTDTIKGLSATISTLKDIKLQRMQRLQELAMTMVELWNLMDTPVEEQQKFQNITRTIAASEHEITENNSLSLESIDNAEAEVLRLQEMKTSKIREVILRKKEVLDEICQGAHMVVSGQFGTDLSVESIESGEISPSDILEQLEFQISKVKEEAFSRKEILEKVQKWLAAREEENWLEEYNRDENRYNAGRGTHLMLKRAEKARMIVNKIQAMVDMLKLKVKAWEQERKAEFLYDGVGLISMLNEYCELKHLKEQECQKQRDQKKLQGQLMTEQEAIYGSKPSPSKSNSKGFRSLTGGAAAKKRFSLGGAVLQNSCSDKLSQPSRFLGKNKNNCIKRQPPHGHHHNNGLAAPLSSGKTSIRSGPIKHQSSNSSNSKPLEPSTLRKALSPLSSLCSNIITSCNNADFPVNTPQQMALKPSSPPSSATTTPTKNVLIYDENRTPRTMPVPVPCTPPTASNAMQTAMTPFTPTRMGGAGGEAEYSYEEKRAGFVVPKSYYNRQSPLV